MVSCLSDRHGLHVVARISQRCTSRLHAWIPCLSCLSTPACSHIVHAHNWHNCHRWSRTKDMPLDTHRSSHFVQCHPQRTSAFKTAYQGMSGCVPLPWPRPRRLSIRCSLRCKELTKACMRLGSRDLQQTGTADLCITWTCAAAKTVADASGVPTQHHCYTSRLPVRHAGCTQVFCTGSHTPQNSPPLTCR